MEIAQIIEWLDKHKDAVASIGLVVSGIWAFWVWKKKQAGSSTIGIQNQNSPNSGNQINVPVTANDHAAVNQNFGDTHYHGLSVDDAMKIAEKLAAEKGEKDAQFIQSLQETIQALTQQNAQKYDIQQAFDLLAQGDTTQAEAIFAAVAAEAKLAGKEANLKEAEALHHLGSLAFLHDTQKAFAAYQRSTELDPDNLDGWNNLGHLYRRIGELDNAENAYVMVQKLSLLQLNRESEAIAYDNLGIVYGIRGDLNCAIEYFERACTIFEELGSKEGMASTYNNLGNVYQIYGDLDRAIGYQEKALVINKQLDRKIGIAMTYGNLGIIYGICGDLNPATEYFEKARTIFKELGNKEGMTSTYNNLGNIYQICGDLDRAIEYRESALAFNRELGDKEGMASIYGNLGRIYQIRGELDRAVDYWKQSLVLFQQLGANDKIALVQSWIDEAEQKDSN